MEENRAGRKGFLEMRSQHAGHQLEEIGAELRAMMPWIAKERLVDKTRN